MTINADAEWKGKDGTFQQVVVRGRDGGAGTVGLVTVAGSDFPNPVEAYAIDGAKQDGGKVVVTGHRVWTGQHDTITVTLDPAAHTIQAASSDGWDTGAQTGRVGVQGVQQAG